jgi:beta-mannosidase
MSLQAQDIKQLESPYYVFPRSGNQHIDLSGDWKLSSQDEPITQLSEVDGNEWISVAYPTSVQMAHFKAGKLGDPYKHLNAREHEKLEQKVWYYKKEFTFPEEAKGNYILLNFDGVDYFTKVWLNGHLLGIHRGIFGGPVIDVSGMVLYGQTNDLLVEVVSANYQNMDYNNRKPEAIVKGWFLTGGSAMEPFFNLGLWRNVRIEIVPVYHIERPFLFTKSIKNNIVTIGFTMEIFSSKNSQDYQLHPWHNTQISNYTFLWQAPQNIKVKDHLTVLLEFMDKGRVAYSKEFSPYVIEGRCWLEEEFTFDNPTLWYPNGMGEQDFYQAKISLKVNEKPVDIIAFDFGIRTIEQVRTTGVRTGDRWQNWQFVVNGKKLFIKGINWMPVDALYDLTAEKYDWAVKMAKNAGIQMFRIWGSALLESTEFYDACNKYGIMVWQDFNIANFDTPDWPQEVWEAQVCQNIFRLRNQPSLAVWCGGNEFNPYSYGNAVSIGILERNIAIFDPTRCFVRTSPDAGSLHSYPDFDPTWYKGFDLIPYVAETGVHCITDPKTIREVVIASELENLSGMYNKEFAIKHPEFVEHFAEYNPARVPRMLSRASHIDDMTKPTLESIAEATQVGAGEFYQVMSEEFQGNYPVTAGLMPWVYKRPWPVVAAINLVDGYGQPSATYYFLKRTYEPTRVSVDIKRLLWAPGEEFPVDIKVLNGVNQPAIKGKTEVKILDDHFEEIWKESKVMYVEAETSVSTMEIGTFKIPENYKEKIFFVIATFYDENGNKISRAEYWPRTIQQMEDTQFYKKFSSEPVEWPTLTKGPWLRPVTAKHKTTLDVTNVYLKSFKENRGIITFTVKNTGKNLSFMTRLEIEGVKRIFFASDNYFLLEPGEVKTIDLEFVIREDKPANQFKLMVGGWNTKSSAITVKL